jgi:hypothetical protein
MKQTLHQRLVTFALAATLFLAPVAMTGCLSHTHVVGDGAQTGQTEMKRQWYILFGLVPLNEVDSQAMAGDADDYTIKTTQSFIDGVIGIFTGIVTIQPRTVKVEK